MVVGDVLFGYFKCWFCFGGAVLLVIALIFGGHFVDFGCLLF